jgi:signal transduction histidine kinase/uncharacterized protein YdeI (BOF family)
LQTAPDLSLSIKMFSKILILILLCQGCECFSNAQSAIRLNEETLTNAVQVRSLKAAVAVRHVPVHLRGIVIGEAEPGGKGFAMQDETSGIYLTSSPQAVAELQPGDEIEVTGVTDAGWFAPSVIVKTLRKLGTKPIPEPKRVTFEELLTGRFEAQWVEIAGIVRSCEPSWSGARQLRVDLATGGGRLGIRWNISQAPEPLVDAEVRVRGVCYYLANTNRQVLNPMAAMPHDMPMIAVPHEVPVIIEVPAASQPFAAPVRPLDSLINSAQEGSYGHRIHVHGVVTRSQPGEFIFIREGDFGLRVQTTQNGELNPGDKVEILGFTKQGNYSLMLEDAMFQKTATGPPPVPVHINNPSSVGQFDANLVEMEGTLVQRRFSDWAEFFDFRTDTGVTFQAMLRTRAGMTNALNLPVGGRFKIIGVCAVDVSYDSSSGVSQPGSFQILLRSADDLVLTSLPSWWTHQRTVIAFSAIAVILVAAIACVVWVARRRLKEQATRRVAAEKEFALIFAERNRMAREIHDTLAQGLGGISIHLEFIKNRLKEIPPEITKHLEITRELVRNSLADVRHAIWDMRSQALQDGNLISALESTARQLTEGSQVTCRVTVTGRPHPLPPVMENELLHIGQEALCNAVKHAGAKEIELQINFAEATICLSVKDNGCGFSTDKPPPRNDSFGLIGMRERVEQLRGQLLIESHPGTGTRIFATVPLAGGRRSHDFSPQQSA